MVRLRKLFFAYKFHLLIFLISFFVLTRFNFDPDFGWHLALGEKYIRGNVSPMDTFSWTLPGYIWGNSYFLYDIFVAFLFNAVGFLWLAIIAGFISTVSIFLVLGKKLNLFTVLAVFFAIVVAIANLGLRPHVFSFFFFSLLLIFLQKRLFFKKYAVPFLVLLFALWSNFHPGYFVGLAVLGAYLFLDFLSKIKSKNTDIWLRILCFTAAFLASFINPFGLEVWKSMVVFNVTRPGYLPLIAEWQSIFFFYPLNIIYAISGLIFVYILWKKFREIEPSLFVIATFVFAWGFVVSAFVEFWAVMFIFIATRYLDFEIKFKTDRFAKIPLYFASVAVFFALFLSFAASIISFLDLNAVLDSGNYPVRAVEYLQKNNLGDDLFNSYEWGGFLDWYFPQKKVFIDGRMSSWSSDNRNVFGDFISVMNGRCDAFYKYPIKTILVTRSFPQKCFGGFHEVYSDNTARVFIKS